MQHVRQRVPVTAVAAWQEYIIIAHGNVLTLCDPSTKSYLFHTQAFTGQAVHGIIVDHATDTLAIWGGRFVRALQIQCKSPKEAQCTLGKIHELADWVFDLSFAPEDSTGLMAVAVTAHNALHMCRISTKSLSIDSQILISGTNCILYSAHITWLSGSQCLIASGTAFGDIILWSCTVCENAEGASAFSTVHYSFSAHDGSVFDVHIASHTASAGVCGVKYILASCSDDRTIRLWDVSDFKSAKIIAEETTRDTGFGSISDDALKPPLLVKQMAHLSRIWHVRFFAQQNPDNLQGQNCSGGSTRLITFGEDACTITWDVISNEKQIESGVVKLSQIHMQRPHVGKNIWSVACAGGLAISGAADGSVAWQSAFTEGQANVSPCLLSLKHSDRHESINSYAFIDEARLLVTGKSGSVWFIRLDAKGDFTSSMLLESRSELRGYSLLTSGAGRVFLAGSAGEVLMYDDAHGRFANVATIDSKVTGVFVSQDQSSAELIVLIVSISSTNAHLCAFAASSTGDTSVLSTPAFEVPLPDSFIVTSFAHFIYGDTRLVALGSRTGAIALLQQTKDGTWPSHVTARVHKKEAVTEMVFLLDKGKRLLWSTGRDGTFAVHQLTGEGDELAIQLVHQLTLPFGPNIEGFDLTSGCIRAWGFNKTQFVCYDVSAQKNVVTVECGGAHRNWAFRSSSQGGTFIWTKASQIFFQSQDKPSVEVFGDGGHGREIKTSAISPGLTQIIATGAEDTDIRLSTYEHGSFKCLHTLRRHVTGIQYLQWSLNGRFLFSSGGFEEFFIWKITPNLPYINFGVVCESANPRSGTSDLRIMHFESVEADRDSDLEDGNFKILMVYSDSTLKHWHYTSETWTLLSSADYLTSCLTTVQRLTPMDTLTTSTDGHLVVWHDKLPTHDLTWTSRHPIHQNSILATLLIPLPSNQHQLNHLIITAGDDNAIGLTRLTPSLPPSILVLPHAHAAAVTGLTVLRSQLPSPKSTSTANVIHPSAATTEVKLLLVSVGNDQRIKIWRVVVDAEKPGVEGIHVELVLDRFTAVADASGVETMRFDDGESEGGVGVLVTGVGMDLWRVDDGRLLSG